MFYIMDQNQKGGVQILAEGKEKESWKQTREEKAKFAVEDLHFLLFWPTRHLYPLSPQWATKKKSLGRNLKLKEYNYKRYYIPQE